VDLSGRFDLGILGTGEQYEEEQILIDGLSRFHFVIKHIGNLLWFETHRQHHLKKEPYVGD